MADWNPQLYRRFEDERTRPARDLLAQVSFASPARVVDLGCGPGNSTELLADRWPEAEVVGTDNSEAMLASARERLPRLRFELSDIATWRPEQAPDVVYANAALQWVGEHAYLFPRLFASLAPGGVLAVQMPDNLDQPSHHAMREVAALPAFAESIGDAAAVRTRILPAAGYYDLLTGEAASVDIWRTTYHHPDDVGQGDRRLAARHRPPALPRSPERRRPCPLPRGIRTAHRHRVSGVSRRRSSARLPAPLHRRHPARLSHSVR